MSVDSAIGITSLITLSMEQCGRRLTLIRVRSRFDRELDPEIRSHGSEHVKHPYRGNVLSLWAVTLWYLIVAQQAMMCLGTSSLCRTMHASRIPGYRLLRAQDTL